MILLFGAKGWVGQRFCSYFQKRHLPFEAVSRKTIDTSSSKSLRAWLKEKRPDFLLNAAGFTGKPNVDACESAKADTLEGNTLLPVRLRGNLRAVQEFPWSHISSGCIVRPTGESTSGETSLVFGKMMNRISVFAPADAVFTAGRKPWPRNF